MSRLVGSAVPRFTEGWQSFQATHQQALDVKQRLLDAGVRVPPYGRLNEYIRQLELSADLRITDIPDRFDWQRLHRATAEIGELLLILDYLATDPEVPGWKAKAHLAMKGSTRPAEGKSNSGAWDAQFELFFAALCRRAGFDVALTEPDVVISRTDYGPLGVAAKRPHSLANLAKLFDRADRQIAASGQAGIIALDISYISSPDDMYFAAPAEPGQAPYIRRLVDSFLNDNHTRMLRIVNPIHTLGIVVYACGLAIDYSAFRLAVARGSVFGNFSPLEDPRLSMFNELRSALTVAV